MRRRAFIGSAAAAGLAGLAGCSASAAPPKPRVPEERLSEGGWVQTDSVSREVFESEFAGVTVTAIAETLIYEDAALAAEVENKTLGAVSSQQAMFFATRVRFDPNLTDLPAGVGRQEIVDRTEEETRASFRQRLEDAGLTNIEQTGTGTFDPATTDATARRTDYAATFAFEDMEFPVSDDRTVTVEGGDIGVAGLIAVWATSDSVLITGGAHPAENFTRDTKKNVSDAITVAVEIDLGLTPGAYREELTGLMANVS